MSPPFPDEAMQEDRGSAVQTFLIADVRGYTRFTKKHGDEAAALLASRFASIVRDCVAIWGGQVIEFRGDEALVCFSSARGAIRAAIQLGEAFVDQTKADPSLPLPVGMGLTRGRQCPSGRASGAVP